MILRIYKINKQTGFLESFPNSTLQAEMYSFEYDCKRMGEAPTITGTIMYPLCLDNYWMEDVCVEFNGERYFIENVPSSSYSNQDARYKHEITFVSERKKLEKTYFKDRLNTRNNKTITDFSFFGDLSVFVAKLNESMDRFNDNTGYTVIIDPNIETEEKNIVIENMYILEALQHAVEEYGVPYYIQGKEIHFGECQNEISTPLKYGVDNALLSIQRNNTNEVIINRITGVGSSENIPYYYPNLNESGNHNVTTSPESLYSNIKFPINYLKIDPYVKLRDGGSATFYKETIEPIGDDNDSVVINTNNIQIDGFTREWKEKEVLTYTQVGTNNAGKPLYKITATINPILHIIVVPKTLETIYLSNKLECYNFSGNQEYISSIEISKVEVTCFNVSGSKMPLSPKIDGNLISVEIPNDVNLQRGIYFTLEETKTVVRVDQTSQDLEAREITFYYDTKYYTDKKNLTVNGSGIKEKSYSNFEKKIELTNNSGGYRDEITYIITREVAGYSDFSLDTAFRANFYGDTATKSFYPINDSISVQDNEGLSYTPWISDTNYLYCRNNNPERRVFTVTMSTRVDLLKPIEYDPSVINVNLVELSYIPDFYRNERDYDCFEVTPKSTSNQFIDYNKFGIKFYDKESVIDGSVITFSPTIDWIDPKQNLMPYKYRQTLGEEMFYEAENNTYRDDNGVFITFPNPYRPIKKSELIAEPKEDIKPTIVGVTNARGERIDMFADIAFDEQDNNTDWEDVDESTQELEHSFFFVKLRRTDGNDGFNLFDQALESGEMTISMTNGQCGSCNFTIMVDEETQKNPVQVDENGDLVRDENGDVVIKTSSPQERQQDTSKAEVWIALKKSKDDYGIILPDKVANIVPTTEDNFVITNILLPNQYITKAEERLEKELLAEMLDKNDDKFEYSIDLSRIFLAENEDIANALNENSAVTIQYNGINHRMYVSSYSYKMDSENPLPNIKIEISKELTITKNKLQVFEDRVIKRVESISANATLNVSNERGGGGKSDIKVVQETGYDTKAVMSQKAVTKAIEQVAYDNQPISVSQTTGFSTTSVMSQRAVTMELSNISSEMNSKVLQTTGGTTNGWMSQKAVTDALTLAKPTFYGIETSVKYVTTTEPYDSYDGSVVYISSDKQFAYKVEMKYYRDWHSSSMYNTTAPKALTNTIFKNTSNNQDYIFDGTDLVLLTANGSNITISQTTGDSTTSVMSQKAVTDELTKIQINNDFSSIPKFSRIINADANGGIGGSVITSSTELDGEIVYLKYAHPLHQEGFYWLATDGNYYNWWSTAGLFKTNDYYTKPNKIFECESDSKQYVFFKGNDNRGLKGYLKELDLPLVKITYNELFQLIDNKSLISGIQYRITDYVTTCNNAGSVSGVTTSSANHQFDIIVTADTNSALNANARVCLHEGDTYFANNNLSEWVVKYDINNDTAKYQWADTTNGKGVIYYMCDEFGNECPYDFKNILFNNNYTFDLNGADYSLDGTYCYENKIKGYYSANKLILNNNVFRNTRLMNNRNNSLAVNCYSNAFGSACSDIKLGIFCYNNKFASISSTITFGNNCINNELDTTKSYFKYVTLENGCSYNKITTSKATGSSDIPQNLHVLSGVLGTNSSINTITLNTVNNSYITKVAKNSSGVIKMYNEADLVG